MNKSSPFPIAIGAGIVFLIIICILLLVFRPRFYVNIQVNDLGELVVGDKLYMAGKVIGEIKKTILQSPSEEIIKVRIDKEFKEFLNESTVFTIAEDQVIIGRKCILCKNCDENAPKIISNHQFIGLSRLKYELACLRKTTSDFWDQYLRDAVNESIAMAEKLSSKVIQELKDFEAEHHDEFVQIIEQIKKDLKELPPKIEKQLDELIGVPEKTD